MQNRTHSFVGIINCRVWIGITKNKTEEETVHYDSLNDHLEDWFWWIYSFGVFDLNLSPKGYFLVFLSSWPAS